MTRKAEACALVSELHGKGITSAATISQLLAISERYTLTLLTDLGLHQPRHAMTVVQALASCGETLAQRVNQFRIGTSRQHRQRIAA